MYSHCVKRVFYSAFFRKCTIMCKHRFGVQLLQNPPLCSSTEFSIYIFLTMKSFNLLWKHSFSLIKYLFSRNSSVYSIRTSIWYFIQVIYHHFFKANIVNGCTVPNTAYTTDKFGPHLQYPTTRYNTSLDSRRKFFLETLETAEN